MNQFPYLNAWLQCLMQIAPPNGLIHIGAGGGPALQYPYTHIQRLLVVEADGQAHARLQAQLQGHVHCHVVQAVVAGKQGEADFFNLSQANESGLCPPEALRSLWPNIKAVRTEKLQATTLQILLAQTQDDPHAFNWAVIDCLPAGELLLGAGGLPDHWDVLVVRTLKEPPASDNTQAHGLPALRQHLATRGLEMVGMEEENHPQIVRALFVRNQGQQLVQAKTLHHADKAIWTKERAELTQARDTQTKLALERQTQLATAIKAQDEQTKLLHERQAALGTLQAQKDQLAKEKNDALAHIEQLAKEKAELTQARDTQTKLALERQTQLATAIKAQDEQVKLLHERQTALGTLQAQKDQLAKEKATLTVARDEQAKLAAECQKALAALQRDAASQQQRIQQHEAEQRESAMRQQLLQEELIKAEAQIELIKDLLLREPGL